MSESSERDDCIYANFEFPPFLFSSLWNGHFRSWSRSYAGLYFIFSCVYDSFFLIYIYTHIHIYKTSVCERERITHAMLYTDMNSERERESRENRENKATTILFVEMFFAYICISFDEKSSLLDETSDRLTHFYTHIIPPRHGYASPRSITYGLFSATIADIIVQYICHLSSRFSLWTLPSMRWKCQWLALWFNNMVENSIVLIGLNIFREAF